MLRLCWFRECHQRTMSHGSVCARKNRQSGHRKPGKLLESRPGLRNPHATVKELSPDCLIGSRTDGGQCGNVKVSQLTRQPSRQAFPTGGVIRSGRTSPLTSMTSLDGILRSGTVHYSSQSSRSNWSFPPFQAQNRQEAWLHARFFTELPESFNPRQFHPEDWATLAHLAGVHYVMFTAKHHSGFAMWDTHTTPFGIMKTPFHRDVTKEVFEAFRAQGIAAGVYYSPDDFWWLYEHDIPIERHTEQVQPRNNAALMQYDQAQIQELLTRYGKVDVLFLDGEPNGLRELAWKIDPKIVVTRGAIKTPELTIPGMPIPGAWETCMTMGIGWQY